MRKTGARCCGPVGAAVAGTRLRLIRFAGVSFFVDEYWVDNQPESFDTLIYLKADAKLSSNCDTSLEAVFASLDRNSKGGPGGGGCNEHLINGKTMSPSKKGVKHWKFDTFWYMVNDNGRVHSHMFRKAHFATLGSGKLKPVPHCRLPETTLGLRTARLNPPPPPKFFGFTQPPPVPPPLLSFSFL